MSSELTANSDSGVQTQAEVAILLTLAAQLGVKLVKPNWIKVGDSAHVEVDGATEDGSVLVEVYARQGVLKGSQPKKVAQDILKLALVRQETGRSDTRLIIAFASQEAHDSIKGWLKHAAQSFDVELLVVLNLDSAIKDQILAAQQLQVMVNPPRDRSDA